MTALSFQFRDCSNVSGLGTGAVAGAFECQVPTSLVPAFGALLVLNGIDINQKVVNPVSNGSTAPWWPLVGNAPFGTVVPLVTPMGTGRIFGQNFKWLVRFKASTTGEVTGFTAVNVMGLSLGQQIGVSTNWLGQNASFAFAGRTGDDGVYFDRIEVFRNTSNEFSIYYKLKELANPGSGATVSYTDDTPDEDVLASGAETDGLLPNPSHASGPPWPVAKAYAHPAGVFLYYGIIQMGTYRNGVAAVTASADYVSITSDFTPSGYVPAGGNVKVPRNRVGQRFVPLATSGGTVITPTQSYRVCAISTGAEGDVDIAPKWAEGALTGFFYEIVDDRDPRTVLRSQPGQPSQIDYLKTLGVGADKTDGVLHIWGFRGRRFSISYRHIYVWENDEFVDPAVVVSHTAVTDEGACGLWAMAETPVGLVYIEASRGPRLFAGVSNLLGVDPPIPLGGQRAEEEFLAITQFQGIDPDYMEQTRVIYDPRNHEVFVSYCPIGGGGLEESLVFEIKTGVWRGPWRTHLTAGFELLDDGGATRFVFGDESGSLLTSDGAALDVVNQLSGQVITGTISTVDNAFTFTATSAAFDPNSDKRVIGCPIVFNDGAGNFYVNWIAGYASNQFQLLYIPSPVLAAGWMFQIGAIRWQMKTAIFDGGDRVQPSKFEKLRLGFERGHTGDSTALLGVAVNGGSTFRTEVQDDGSTETLINPADPKSDTDDGAQDGNLYTEGRVARSGRAYQIRMRGTSVTGDPQVTIAVADIDVHGGA